MHQNALYRFKSNFVSTVDSTSWLMVNLAPSDRASHEAAHSFPSSTSLTVTQINRVEAADIPKHCACGTAIDSNVRNQVRLAQITSLSQSVNNMRIFCMTSSISSKRKQNASLIHLLCRQKPKFHTEVRTRY